MSEKNIRTRILGVDYGKARLGISLSDESLIIASPLPYLEAQRKMEMTLKKLINLIDDLKGDAKEINEVVIGLPYKMNGTLSPMGEEIKQFAALLEEGSSYKVTLWDERLSTVQAERAMREGGLSRKKRSKSIDSLSAVLILQSYLEMKTN